MQESALVYQLEFHLGVLQVRQHEEMGTALSYKTCPHVETRSVYYNADHRALSAL
jgi:hypothetical protein